MRIHDSGLRESKKPTSALSGVSLRIATIAIPVSSQRSGIAKGLPELARDFVLRREVDLLKQLGGDGQAAGCADPLQRFVGVHVVVQVVTWKSISTSFASIHRSERTAAVGVGVAVEVAVVLLHPATTSKVLIVLRRSVRINVDGHCEGGDLGAILRVST